MQHTQVSWPYNSSAVVPMIPGGGQPQNLVPRIDVLESPSEIVCVLEIPGVKVDKIEVEVVDQQLSVNAATYSDLIERDPGLKYSYRERTEGSVYRLIPLPSKVDAATAVANYREGLLTVRMPKTAPTDQQGKHISVSHLD